MAGGSHYYQGRYSDLGEKLKVAVFVEIANRKGDRLGLPLPKGVVRVSAARELLPWARVWRSKSLVAVLAPACASLLLLPGCSSPRSAVQNGAEHEALIWPDPPEKPRIAYVQSLGRPSDAGVKLARLSRFANWLTGADKGNEALLKLFGLGLDEADNLCLTDTGANAV